MLLTISADDVGTLLAADPDPVLVLVEGRTAVIGSADLDTAAFQMGG
ncbi:MAG: hypothetical protein JO330_19105 [Mycobacteriaceae bacterium]|nr:hypothetical protein [Mycobacteriaceae bacterium]